MNEQDLEYYRRRLIEIEHDLVARVVTVESEREEVMDVDAIEPMERAQAATIADTLENLDGLEREQLEEVEAALDRIDDGTYGTCVDCGREIPRARLDAVPWARRCEHDQERFERERAEVAGSRPGARL